MNQEQLKGIMQVPELIRQFSLLQMIADVTMMYYRNNKSFFYIIINKPIPNVIRMIERRSDNPVSLCYFDIISKIISVRKDFAKYALQLTTIIIVMRTHS